MAKPLYPLMSVGKTKDLTVLKVDTRDVAFSIHSACVG